MTDPRLRVLFYIKNLNGGGAERGMVDLLNSIDRTEFLPRLLLNRQDGPYLRQVEPADLVPARTGFEGGNGWLSPSGRVRRSITARIGSARAAKRLPAEVRTVRGRRLLHGIIESDNYVRFAAAVRAFRPHVVVSSLLETASTLVYLHRHVLASRNADYSWVAVEQNNTAARSEMWYDREDSRFWHAMASLVYGAADRVVAVSDGVRQHLEDDFRLGANRIEVIPNQVDVEGVQRAARAVVDRPYILAAGRLHPQKDFHSLLRAFALIAGEVSEDLVIVGDGPERGSLEATARELGIADRVRMPGFSDAIWSLMKSASCFAMSSKYEGLPLTMLEALAAGAPVVSFDCDYGPREVITHRVDGVLVSPGDVDGLARAIREVLLDREFAGSLSRNGQARARDFDRTTVTREYERLICQQLMARPLASREFNLAYSRVG
ncbi:MAG TPA: glycosyltransferase [Thermomicrobiales bacterium]|nr:glycosyltransferase [Thermomicrobiales bacterium]